MSRGLKENKPCVIWHITAHAYRPTSVALTDCPKSPLSVRIYLFVNIGTHPFHNFSQGQLDLAMLTGEMIEDIIGAAPTSLQPKQSHTRARSHRGGTDRCTTGPGCEIAAKQRATPD